MTPEQLFGIIGMVLALLAWLFPRPWFSRPGPTPPLLPTSHDTSGDAGPPASSSSPSWPWSWLQSWRRATTTTAPEADVELRSLAPPAPPTLPALPAPALLPGLPSSPAVPAAWPGLEPVWQTSDGADLENQARGAATGSRVCSSSSIATKRSK